MHLYVNALNIRSCEDEDLKWRLSTSRKGFATTFIFEEVFQVKENKNSFVARSSKCPNLQIEN